MTATLVVDPDLYRSCRAHLAQRAEGIGFFMADYESTSRAFVLRQWRAIPASGLEASNEFHVALQEDMQADIIKWAWNDGGSLVEAHSHGPDQLACFSPFDVDGFDEWVPHIWWRLRGRPYAAIVIAGDSTDALAWIEGPATPEQIEGISVSEHLELSTRATFTQFGRGRGWVVNG